MTTGDMMVIVIVVVADDQRLSRVYDPAFHGHALLHGWWSGYLLDAT